MSVSTMRGGSGWGPGARAQGFTSGDGGENFHRIGMTLETVDGWGAISHPTFESGLALVASQMGRPGLWRQFAVGRAEFDFPPPELLAERVKFEELLDWAMLTADGRLPRDWCAPPLEDIRAAAGDARLVAGAGALVVQGEIMHTETRLAIVFPELLRLPEDLGPARRAWIENLTAAAQRRWRLVRIGSDPSGAVLRAEVDLTGAPHHALDALVRLSISSLRTVIEWVLPTLRLAADPSVSSEILDTQPPADEPAERTD